jgi:hypothetical protein
MPVRITTGIRCPSSTERHTEDACQHFTVMGAHDGFFQPA